MGAYDLPMNRFQTELRDTRRRLDAIDRQLASGSWISFTPGLTASPTPPTLSNNASEEKLGIYMVQNGLLFYNISVKFGTAGVAAGSGTYYLTGLPIAPLSTPTRPSFGAGQARLTGPSLFAYATVIADSGSNGLYLKYVAAYPTSATDVSVDHDSPWVWAANNRIEAWGWYPIANLTP